MTHNTNARALAILLAFAGVGAASLAVAQTPPPAPPGGPGSMGTPPRGPGLGGPGARRGGALPASDGEFVAMLRNANTAELDMAKFMINGTTNADVKTFAQKMIDDHSTAAVKLSAATRGVSLTPEPGRARNVNALGARAVGMLQGVTGTQRDNLYMRMQVPAHQHVLAILGWETKNGKNTPVKTLATDLAPTVQQHLQLAQAYLSAHNLTPLEVQVNPVPGSVNPNSLPPGGTQNNPAAPGAQGSSRGQETGTGGTTRNPLTPPSAQPLGGQGTPGPGPAPTPSAAGPQLSPSPAPTSS